MEKGVGAMRGEAGSPSRGEEAWGLASGSMEPAVTAAAWDPRKGNMGKREGCFGEHRA